VTAAALVIAALLVVAVGVQVWYARSILKTGVEVGNATKVVWGLNIGLLLVLLVGLTWFLFVRGAS
jgi:hypothetical protein